MRRGVWGVRVWVVALSLACAGCAPRDRAYDRASPAVSLHGEGSTFAAALYGTWAEQYRRVEPSTAVTYTGTDSGHGVDAILAGHVAFGGSDPPIDPAKNKDGAIVELPMMLGGVVLGYRLDAFKSGDAPAPLALTPELVARIFRGNITRWNDPAIASANDPKTPLPDLAIQLVFRSGSSGTTTVFTDYLTRTAHDSWSPGKTGSLDVPGGKPAASNDAVASAITSTNGAVGYLDYAYAAGKVRMAAVRNRAGRFVQPTLQTISAAAAAARPATLSDPLLDPPGEDSYPISSFSYALVHGDTADRDTGVALARFLWWAAHDGQALAPAKGFVTLPAEILVRLETLLYGLRAGGEPSLAQD